MSTPDLPISVLEKLDVFRILFGTIAIASYTCLTALFRGPDGATTWAREVFTRVVRHQGGSLSLTQRRWLRPNTGAMLANYCWKQSILLETVQLAHGTKLHWVGDRTATKVILYYHGGGYVHSMVPGHVKFLRECVKKFDENGKKVVLAIVEYGLAPGIRYPIQYIQGSEALRYLLNEGYKPSNILIGGDSAGGNLALGVISHILHPHSKIDEITLSQPFGGILLMSPWVTFADTAPSAKINAEKDYLDARDGKIWGNMFCDSADRNEYSVPLSADPSWWKGFPAQKTLIVYGDWEVPRDDITAISKKMTEEVQGLTVVNCPREVHVACVIDAQFGLEPQDMAKTVFAWLGTIFS